MTLRVILLIFLAQLFQLLVGKQALSLVVDRWLLFADLIIWASVTLSSSAATIARMHNILRCLHLLYLYRSIGHKEWLRGIGRRAIAASWTDRIFKVEFRLRDVQLWILWVHSANFFLISSASYLGVVADRNHATRVVVFPIWVLLDAASATSALEIGVWEVTYWAPWMSDRRELRHQDLVQSLLALLLVYGLVVLLLLQMVDLVEQLLGW